MMGDDLTTPRLDAADAHLLRVCIKRYAHDIAKACEEDQGDPAGAPGTVGHEVQQRLGGLLEWARSVSSLEAVWAAAERNPFEFINERDRLAKAMATAMPRYVIHQQHADDVRSLLAARGEERADVLRDLRQMRDGFPEGSRGANKLTRAIDMLAAPAHSDGGEDGEAERRAREFTELSDRLGRRVLDLEEQLAVAPVVRRLDDPEDAHLQAVYRLARELHRGAEEDSDERRIALSIVDELQAHIATTAPVDGSSCRGCGRTDGTHGMDCPTDPVDGLAELRELVDRSCREAIEQHGIGTTSDALAKLIPAIDRIAARRSDEPDDEITGGEPVDGMRWDGTEEGLRALAKWAGNGPDGEPQVDWVTDPLVPGPHDVMIGDRRLDPGSVLAKVHGWTVLVDFKQKQAIVPEGKPDGERGLVLLREMVEADRDVIGGNSGIGREYRAGLRAMATGVIGAIDRILEGQAPASVPVGDESVRPYYVKGTKIAACATCGHGFDYHGSRACVYADCGCPQFEYARAEPAPQEPEAGTAGGPCPGCGDTPRSDCKNVGCPLERDWLADVREVLADAYTPEGIEVWLRARAADGCDERVLRVAEQFVGRTLGDIRADSASVPAEGDTDSEERWTSPFGPGDVVCNRQGDYWTGVVIGVTDDNWVTVDFTSGGTGRFKASQLGAVRTRDHDRDYSPPTNDEQAETPEDRS